MKRLAFGPLGLKPDEFWRLTPAELSELAEGYRERMDHVMHIVAWHAANVMNVHLRRKVTPAKLLGKGRVMSDVERRAKFAELKKLLDERRGRLGSSPSPF